MNTNQSNTIHITTEIVKVQETKLFAEMKTISVVNVKLSWYLHDFTELKQYLLILRFFC